MKGDFQRPSPAPRPLGSNACRKPVRLAEAKSAGYRLYTGTAFSFAWGEDRPDICVLAEEPAGVEISDRLETGIMVKSF